MTRRMCSISFRNGPQFKTAAVLFLSGVSLWLACSGRSASEAGVAGRTAQPPEWSYNLAIYEVNLRQYSEAGTFLEFEKHLPRLKEMGVGILWFMPIHPIGEKNRKGSLGSYYAVKDYLAVNPEHGTIDDFKKLVKKIHDLGMYVILDWVANHTAWDNPLTVQHPEWYTKDTDGNFVTPVPDWHDVIDLNYDSPDLREYMIDALKFWVEEADVDGFRCDVAEMVPLDFWLTARQELDRGKPVFMLAEGEAPELHQAFDMTYSWNLFNLLNKIATGETAVTMLADHLTREEESYPTDAFRMLFTTNHDENSWNGTVFERLRQGAKAFAVLTLTLPGMPLIYSGQEAGLDKRLAFFEKDAIEWRDHEVSDVYSKLLALKRTNTALWHGSRGGDTISIPTTRDNAIFAFLRQNENDRVLVVLNLSDSTQLLRLQGHEVAGEYTDVFANQIVPLSAETELKFEPWEFRVYTR